MTDPELKNDQNISIGDLVEYMHPFPESEKLLGVVLRMRKIESNVYERGYVEADVRWTEIRWDSNKSWNDRYSLYETHEDVSRLIKLS